MRILMFGWEFPPYISGGLGTACYGMTLGLAECDVKVLFVTPSLESNKGSSSDKGTSHFHSHLKMHSASGTKITLKDEQISEEFFNKTSLKHIASSSFSSINKVSFHHIESPLTPYLNEETYNLYNTSTHSESFTHTDTEDIHTKESKKHTHSQEFEKTVYVKGGYGKTLFEEVFRYAQVASALAREQEYDVIHAHDWITFPAAALAKKISNKPLIVHAHATEFDRSKNSVNQQVYDIERMGFEVADKVIAVSARTKQILVDRYGIDPNKIHVVYNAVLQKERKKQNKDELIPPLMKDEKRVLFMGRITHQKGPEYFVEAAKIVYEKMPNVRFIMAGSGDMTESMIKKVSELRMGSRFHFTGFIKGDEVDKMYSIADVYVMPSVSEPFGIAPLEALVCGTPTLVSKQSGVAEVLKNTLKVDFWDTEELASKICTMLTYESLTSVMVEKGLEELETITWVESAKEIKKIYSSLIFSKLADSRKPI